jgi:hypothetical protein
MSDNLLMGILPADIVTFDDKETPITTSLKVAEVFQKEHKHVLRDIREIIECFTNFKESPKAPISRLLKIEPPQNIDDAGSNFIEKTRETSAFGSIRQEPFYFAESENFPLTTRIGCAMVKSSNDFIGVSRKRSGIFYANFRPLLHARVEKAPVSAYREVCGKRPMRLVENTGALSFLKSKSLQNNIIGGSI